MRGKVNSSSCIGLKLKTCGYCALICHSLDFGIDIHLIFRSRDKSFGDDKRRGKKGKAK